MSEYSSIPLPKPNFLKVGTDGAARHIAYHHLPAETQAPSLFWLGGFRSDMDGTKALALEAFARKQALGFTRFDYSGHGLSGGDFLDGTISRWLEEAKAVITATSKPQERCILIGSSMGGWLAFLLAKALQKEAEKSGVVSPTVHGIVLIAPAMDMTEDLMWQLMTEEERVTLQETGQLEKSNDYSPEPYILTRTLIEDGRKHLFGPGVIEMGCPVFILQGGQDTDVPSAHVLKLVSQMPLDDVILRLIPDGDHRLSSPTDLQEFMRAIDILLAK